MDKTNWLVEPATPDSSSSSTTPTQQQRFYINVCRSLVPQGGTWPSQVFLAAR